jgi:hypothetical protein
MSARRPLDYDVSVAADKRRRMRRRGLTGAFGTAERGCDWEGCAAAGEYRAPRSPDQLDEFHWFCLDHVRDYNRTWNYFRDWSDADLEAQLRADTVWDRPTWNFASGATKAATTSHAEGRAWARFGFEDPFDVLGENATMNPGPQGREKQTPRAPVRRGLPPALARAYDVLGAPHEAGRAELRARYRALVKDLHPDMNGGARTEEGRLREVLWAWDQIKDNRLVAD